MLAVVQNLAVPNLADIDQVSQKGLQSAAREACWFPISTRPEYPLSVSLAISRSIRERRVLFIGDLHPLLA